MKVLFFAPHSAIWIQAFPEALVAQTLASAGCDVLYIGCGGEYQRYCIPMNALGLTAASDTSIRESVCRRCKDLRNIIVTDFRLRAIDVHELLDDNDRASVNQILSNVDRTNYLDLEHYGIAAGKIALYECLLHHKKLSLEFSPDQCGPAVPGGPPLGIDQYSLYTCGTRLCGPVEPVGPINPIGPVAPVGPPGGPCGPVKPVGPIDPVGPVDPVEPVEPVGPPG